MAPPLRRIVVTVGMRLILNAPPGKAQIHPSIDFLLAKLTPDTVFTVIWESKGDVRIGIEGWPEEYTLPGAVFTTANFKRAPEKGRRKRRP